ncbi:Beta-N-acetylhexosaminidase [Lactobacillus helveticus]|nr:Beta-N-acetylhexosaminidase [Lactobacillus helveticus]
MEPKKERFSIRKFSVGAASVLIGFFFMNSIGDQQVQAADNNPAVKPDDAKVAQSESGTKDTTEVTKNDGSVESLEENPDVKKIAATIKPIKKTEETSSTGNENNVEANKSVDQNANSVNKTSEQVAAPKQEEKKATQKPVTSQNQAQSESIQNKKNNTKTDQTGKTKETKTVKLPDTPKTLSLADFTKETKELETKLPNMSEAERKAVADELLADQKTLSAADQAKLATMISEQADISNGQTEHAHDYSSFLSALRNANASTIVLDNDIDFRNANLKHGLLNLQGGNWERLNNKGIARTVTIQGSKKADGTITELKFGDRYIAFTDDNQSNGQGWHIKLSDLTLQTENVYGPLYFALVGVTNAGQDYVEYHNVTTTTDTKRVFNSDAANVQFSGANVLNSSSENGGAAIYANSVEVLDGNTIVNALPDVKTTAGGDGNAAILIGAYKSHGNVVIDEGANLTVNTDGHYGKQSDNTYDPNRNHDMLGIRYQGAGAQGKSIDEATGGVVRVKKNGSLTINTGTGGSTAIEAGHLDVQDGANVTINSKHDTHSTAAGGTHLGHAGDHWGPIMLGYADGDNNAEARIGKGANLTIKRTSSEAYAPMISFGGMANNGKTFRVEVNGGTLDLQDSAKDVATWQKSWVTNAPRAGMITMWGTGGNDTIE